VFVRNGAEIGSHAVEAAALLAFVWEQLSWVGVPASSLAEKAASDHRPSLSSVPSFAAAVSAGHPARVLECDGLCCEGGDLCDSV
jgi:hypothetical protein